MVIRRWTLVVICKESASIRKLGWYRMHKENREMVWRMFLRRVSLELILFV